MQYLNLKFPFDLGNHLAFLLKQIIHVTVTGMVKSQKFGLMLVLVFSQDLLKITNKPASFCYNVQVKLKKKKNNKTL